MAVTVIHTCARCRADFEATHERARFCSSTCRVATWRKTRDRRDRLVAEILRAQAGDAYARADAEANRLLAA